MSRARAAARDRDIKCRDLHYDDFLFAEIGEQKNGMMISMISALARLGFDPWEEAQRLATLPTEVAVRAVTTLIGRLSDLKDRASGEDGLATNLVARLSRGGRAPTEGPPVAGATWWHASLQSDPKWLVVGLIAGAVVLVLRLCFPG